jgi:hypothetical protein
VKGGWAGGEERRLWASSSDGTWRGGICEVVK